MGKQSRSKRERRQTLPPIVTPPQEIATAIDRISADDRDWFDLNPGAQERIRHAAPHEFWPNFDSAGVKYVIVQQVWPGFRLRLPVLRLHRQETERIQ
jgi:hypothetical protein